MDGKVRKQKFEWTYFSGSSSDNVRNTEFLGPKSCIFCLFKTLNKRITMFLLSLINSEGRKNDGLYLDLIFWASLQQRQLFFLA